MDPTDGTESLSTKIFWTQILLSGAGILLNIIFLWRADRKREAENNLDSTLLFATICKIVTGVGMALRTLIILYAQNIYPNFYRIFGAADIFVDGMFIWNILIRNVWHFSELKRLQTGVQLRQDTNANSGKIKSLILTTTIVALLSFGYGIIIRLPRDEIHGNLDIAIYSMNGISKQLPFVINMVVTILASLKFGCILYKRKHIVHSEMASEAEQRENNEILRQFVLELICQFVVFVAPGCFVYTNELFYRTFDDDRYIYDITKETYWLMRCILCVLNPIVFGPPKRGTCTFSFKTRQHLGDAVEETCDQGSTYTKHKFESDMTAALSANKEMSPEALKIFSVCSNSPDSPKFNQSMHSLQSLVSPLQYSPKSLASFHLEHPVSPLKAEKDKRKVKSLLTMNDLDKDNSMFSPTSILNRIYSNEKLPRVGSAHSSPF